MIDKNYDCLYSYCSYIYRYSLSTTRRFRMSFIMTIGHSFKWSKLCLKIWCKFLSKYRQKSFIYYLDFSKKRIFIQNNISEKEYCLVIWRKNKYCLARLVYWYEKYFRAKKIDEIYSSCSIICVEICHVIIDLLYFDV